MKFVLVFNSKVKRKKESKKEEKKKENAIHETIHWLVILQKVKSCYGSTLR